MPNTSLFSQLRQFYKGLPPGQVILQLTDRCNAKCPQCSMRVSEKFTRSRLPLDRCKQIIDQAADRGVQALSITGGEPLLYPDDVFAILNYANDAGIKYTRTGTNGFLFNNPDSANFSDRIKRTIEKIAGSAVRNFWISIDSASRKTHEQMRGFPEIIKGIEKAIPLFHESGLYPTANLGLNRNLGGNVPSILTTKKALKKEHKDEFQAAVEQGLSSFFRFAQNLGFTIVNFCYPMSIEGNSKLEAVYPASSVEHIVRFNDLEKSWLFESMLRTIPQFRSSIRIFSPLSSIHTLHQIYSGATITPFPCSGGKSYFFINASDGFTYPCGYRGMDNLGDYRNTNPQDASKLEEVACNRCDWECFRDPSEFFGPLTHGLRSPYSLVSTYKRSRDYYKYWLSDIRYYRACDFFDGRKDVSQKRLEKYAAPKKSNQNSLQTAGNV